MGNPYRGGKRLSEKLAALCLQTTLAVMIHLLAWGPGAGSVWASALQDDLTASRR